MTVFDLEYERDSSYGGRIFQRKLPRTKPEVTIIDTQTAIMDLVDTISSLPNSPPSLYLDLEGENLGRNGTIAIMQLHLLTTNHTYLIDIQTLQHAAFTTAGASGTTTLKSILEWPGILKVFFDVRHDSDALYHLYGIELEGIKDLQLMKHATDPSRRYLSGLAACIRWDGGLTDSELEAAEAIKEAGKKLFYPEQSGSCSVFAQRPIPEDIVRYCAQDANLLPLLYERYDMLIKESHFSAKLQETVAKHEKGRVEDSKTEGFGSWGKESFTRAPGGRDWEPDMDLEDTYWGVPGAAVKRFKRCACLKHAAQTVQWTW